MMKYSEILALAKAEFKDESNWNKDGFFFKGVSSFTKERDVSLKADCMCGMGAVIKVNFNDFVSPTSVIGLNRHYDKFIEWVDNKVHIITDQTMNSFYHFNDDPDTTFKDLHNMFDKLIKLAKAEDI